MLNISVSRKRMINEHKHFLILHGLERERVRERVRERERGREREGTPTTKKKTWLQT